MSFLIAKAALLTLAIQAIVPALIRLWPGLGLRLAQKLVASIGLYRPSMLVLLIATRPISGGRCGGPELSEVFLNLECHC